MTEETAPSTPPDGVRVDLVDAFAHRPGEGNRAAVLRCAAFPPEPDMAALARRLAEPITVFLVEPADRGMPWRMRWYAPSGELMSCGHGTLAAADLLLGDDPAATVTFDTALGRLTARRRGRDVWIDMPAERLTDWTVPRPVADALGTEVTDGARSARHALVALADPAAVEALRPDLDALATLPSIGFAVTAAVADDRYDIVSRWFVPRLGLEDQATGTAHCLLGPFWASRRGWRTIRARQASANGADIGVELAGSRVWLGGGAVRSGCRTVYLPGGHAPGPESR